MTVRTHLRTIDLARASQISVQQVRNYEADGLIPPAQRSAGGYRLYTQKHLVALKTARSLIGGYGGQRTRAIMQAVQQGNLSAALALIDERHAEIAGKRLQIEQTLVALRILATRSSAPAGRRHAQPLHVGAAAKLVGVQVSALHFWEQQGLLQPIRDKQNRYRLYDEQQLRRLRVVVLLREASYDFDAIRTTLDELAAGQTDKAIAAVERRRAELARTSAQCLAAMAAFEGYIREFWAELWNAL